MRTLYRYVMIVVVIVLGSVASGYAQGTRPAAGVTPFTIANGDWSVSPGGNTIVFQGALDGNLWLLAAGEPLTADS